MGQWNNGLDLKGFFMKLPITPILHYSIIF